MTVYTARIVTKIQPAILDPQGKAIETALRVLGIQGITRVRQNKLFEIVIDNDGTAAEVEKVLRKAIENVLINPIMEEYEFKMTGANQ